jgi:hypothetical protein
MVLGKVVVFAAFAIHDTRQRINFCLVFSHHGTQQTLYHRLQAVSVAFLLLRVAEALGKVFAECPTKSTRQRALCHPNLGRVRYAEDGTQQNFC